MNYVSCADYKPTFNFKWLKKKGRKSAKADCLLSEYINLDTETSHNHNEENPKGWVYQWAFGIGDTIVYGRYPSELMQVLSDIVQYTKADDNHKIVVFVHNLSYDISYLKWYILQEFGDYKILCQSPHHFISFEVLGLIFRCSYVLSNKSLEKWGNDLNIEHKKKTGLIDYDIIRYPDDELTADDWVYMFFDILSHRECIEKQLELYSDDLLSIPLTSTGYVRRVAREHFNENPVNRRKFQSSQLDCTTYALCREEFAGALVHGNINYAGETVRGNIRHRDYTSHYPTQQKVKTAPVGAFALWSRGGTIAEALQLVPEYCILVNIIIENARLKDKSITFPYMQESKVKAGKLTHLSIIADNGRIMKFEGVTRIVCTEDDLKWIYRQYDFDDYEILEVYRAKAGVIPKYLQDTVDEFFHGKSYYKNLLKANPDNLDIALSLMKSKNGLNGIYGMTATDPVREDIKMETTGEWVVTHPSEIDTKKLLGKYYNNRNSFMAYQLGVWTTSRARDELMTVIADVVGYENSLYCDTDSLFYLSTPDIEQRLDEYNARLRADAERLHAFIEVDGKRVYYNTFEDENENINAFRFLHAKCYAYEVEGKLKCTIAGVTAKNKARTMTREEELGGIDNLQTGFEFVECGGTRCIYTEDVPRVEYIEGHKVEIASACIIMPTTKTLHGEFDGEMDFFTKGIEMI